ncbi:centrosomal protein kizuna isoform X3 [Mustela putorius furo]|uniref:Centrosomal protein kizuna n=1 Tax=Mustela putorius furo TaxID=9669 RepID=A0A8U0UZG6_MUSPF|nr:centrosomal protein kizuna isoform X3 [Mustela putorius furo]
MVGLSPQTTRRHLRGGCPLAVENARGGGMLPSSTSAAPLASPEYYERLGRLQDRLRDSEKKRLDLEKKLYEYNQSDAYRVKLKYVKLKKYLKEICESEKKAHTRNREYLKQFEHVQAHVGHFTTNTEKLQELKNEYEAQVKKVQLLSKESLGTRGEPKDEDRRKVARQAGINLGTAMSRGLYQPATIFMGRQMSAVSSIGGFSTEQKSPQPTKNFSIPDPHSHRQTAQSDHLPPRGPESQKPFRKMQEEQEEKSLSSSSSDLTVSVSEDDLIFKSPEPQPNPSDKMEGEDGREALKLIHSEQERDALSTEKHNCILQTLSSSDSKKESSTNSPTRELYNHSDILEEDLETCRAAVLHQFLRPLSAGDSSEKQVRSEQAAAAALLRAHLGQRVTTLQEHDNSIREEVAKSSQVFPVKNMDQMTRATALLKKALTEECEDRSAIHSNESSCSLPSILNDNSGIKEAKPAQWLNSVCTKEQEVSSGCGDESKEESMAAKIPITETKAYQLLKQSTLQDNINHTEDRFQKADVSVLQLSGLNIGSGTFKTKTTNKIVSEASFSSSKGSPLSRHENEKKLPTTLESKAFWGESDDSNSEIEAALRPRNHNTSADDFDDFYD